MIKKDIFNFNHIDKNISKEKLSEIKALYKFYHKLFWCYKKAFKHFKRLNLIINISSTSLVVIGTIAGAITLNTIILGTISGAGLVLKTVSEITDYKKKIEMSKFAYTTYEKVLVDLRSSLRGNQFNHTAFIYEMRLIDEMIIDLCGGRGFVISMHLCKKYARSTTTNVDNKRNMYERAF